MSSGARVDTAVFDFLRPRLKEYREQTTDLKTAVAGSVAKVVSGADDVVSERRRLLQVATAEYESCCRDPEADCSGYLHRMKLAEGKLEEARRGREIIERAREAFRHAQIRHDTVVDRELLRGEKMVREADERTIGYQKSIGGSPSVTLLSGSPLGGTSSSGGGSAPLSSAATSGGAHLDLGFYSGGGGSASWRDAPGVVVPAAFPAGFALVPIGSIADTDPVSGPQDFDSGQDLPALKWSANALLDVVLPALVREGADIESVRSSLSDRDSREGLHGDRTYSRTFAGFFGDSSAMKVGFTATTGFDLQNGRHRIWLLKRLGAEQIPVRVSGAGS